MNDKELLPCPKCGLEDTYVNHSNSDGFAGGCSDCGYWDDNFFLREQAIKSFNKKAFIEVLKRHKKEVRTSFPVPLSDKAVKNQDFNDGIDEAIELFKKYFRS